MNTLSETAKAQRRQRRMDNKRRAELPLFTADPAQLEALAPLPSVADLERERRQLQAACYAQGLRRIQRNLREWLRLRALVERYFTLDQIAHIEARNRRVYPTSIYDKALTRCDYWHSLLRELGIQEG